MSIMNANEANCYLNGSIVMMISFAIVSLASIKDVFSNVLCCFLLYFALTSIFVFAKSIQKKTAKGNNDS